MIGRSDGRTDGQVGGLACRRTDDQAVGRTDGRTDEWADWPRERTDDQAVGRTDR